VAAAIVLPAYADEPSQKTREALRREFEWLQAEAEGTVTIATKTKMSVNDAPSIVSVITEEEIKNSGAKNLEEVLRQVSGFYINKTVVFHDMKIGIRGLIQSESPGVRIMVNGHSVENVMNDNSGIISFPIGLIKKIEIIRGPGSALYGNEAMNGVINIITKDEKAPSAISAGYGSFDTYEATGQFSYSKNDLSLFFFADTTRSDGDPQFIGKDMASLMFPPGFSHAPGYSNEDFTYNSFFAKLSYKDFRLMGSYRKNEAQPFTSITGALTNNGDTLQEKAFVEAGYESSLTQKTKLNAKVYYDYSYDDFNYEMFGSETTPLFGNFPKGQSMIGHVSTKCDRVGGEVMTDIAATESLEIVAGVLGEYLKLYDAKNYFNANVTGSLLNLGGVTYMPMEYLGSVRDQPFDTTDEGHRSIYAGYVQGTWNLIKAFPSLENIGKTLTFTAGARDDYYSDAGGTLNPRLGLVYAPNDKLFFKLLYGQAFRAPSFAQMYIKNNSTIFGNPDLKPELVKTSEIQAGVNLTEHITATLNFFSIKKEDAIALYMGRWDNRGEVESQGVEGEIRASFGKSRYAYFNATFQKAKDVTHDTITDSGGKAYTQDDYDLGNYPEVIANMGVNNDISRYVNANISVSYIGSMNRVGKMQFTASKNDPDGTLEKSDQREATGSYALVNFSLIFHNFDFAKGWEFQITGYDIFNADQRDPEVDGSLPNDLPRWGRNFMGKLSYTF
jgi:iron complex outermembrane receptor protein